MADSKGFEGLPPIPRGSGAISSALVVINDTCYFFYYNQQDGQKLHCAIGKENQGFPSTPIIIDSNPIKPPPANFPFPLAAGYDATAKQLHVFYVRPDGLIDNVYSSEGTIGTLWNAGDLDKATVSISLTLSKPGTLAAYPPGNFWRLMVRTQANPDNFTEVFKNGSTWSTYVIQ